MYYGLILISVVMFGGCFAFKDLYRKRRGSSFFISMECNVFGSLSGLIVLLIANGIKFEFTPFTLLIALLTAANSVGFSFFSFRALDSINLSLFSLFSMLGGMLLPSAVGILFFGEGMTLAKGVCYLLILIALVLTVEKGEKKGGVIYYAGVFVLNGMSGVLSKIYEAAPFEKASAAGFSILAALVSVLLSGILWVALLVKKKRSAEIPSEQKPLTLCTVGIGALSGAINKAANLLLLIALFHVDASVQYPMVTGGVMIVSTAIAFFSDNKPKRKDVLSIGVAFLGMLALFLIPM